MSPPPSRKRVTIRDVARFARVSHQTVSRFINGENHIAPLTRTRVEQAIAKLRFHPSHIARSLVSRQTKTVGLVMGDVASPFFPDVARGAEDVLAAAGYSLILSSSRRDPERELRNVRHLLERSTDGLILGRAAVSARRARRAGPARRRPDGVPQPRGEGAPRRRGLDRLAGRHRRGRDVPGRPGPPAHRAGRPVPERRPGRQPGGLVPPGAGPGRPRSRAGADLPGRHVARGRPRAPASACSPSSARPTAAICHNDVMAIGLLQACAEQRGARAPGPLDRRVGRRAVREPGHAARSPPCACPATSSGRRRPGGCSI